MRLLFLTQALDLDDPVLGFAHEWVAALARHCDQVIAAPVRAGRVSLPENVDVRPLHDRLGGAALAKLRSFSRIVGGACRRGEVDAVFAHMVPRYVVYAAPFAKPRRIPLFLWYTHKGVDWSLRMAEPLVKKAFTASDRSFRLDSRKKVVTGHGIDTARFTPPVAGDPPASADTVTVGRIAPVKDPLTLVEAAGLLAREGRPIRALLAGDTLLEAHDQYHETIRSRIEDLGLRDQVRVTGAVPHDQVRHAMLAAPLFVLPSLTGSVDKTVLEAMACGRIPLTCNESFEEVFGDLAPRLTFRPGDARGLADRIREHLDASGEDRRDLADRLRSIVVEQHDLQCLIARLIDEMKSSI